MRPWLDGMHVPGRSPMRSGAGLGHHVPTVPRALGSGIARRRRIPAQCDHSFRPNVNACVAGRWLSFGLAPPIPGRVAPDWISPDLRPTTTAAHAARFVLGETPRSAARLHCSPVPECRVALGSRADRGGHRPLPGGAPRAHCVPPPRAEPRLAAAGIDTHAAGAARVPGAVGRARHKAPFAHASQAFLAHHSPYALGVDAPALGMQRVGDTPAAVAPPDLRFLMLGREFKSRDITPMARTC